MSEIRILCVNSAGERVAASAAKLSTTAGGAYAIYDAADDAEKNRRLVGKVLKSGHTSILEHITLNLAVRASVAVEQFFIEFRLASFTVKSRRYVDFVDCGYLSPAELAPAYQASYDALYALAFRVYDQLTQQGVPKEDSRFVLPYGFYSDFYCTVNARELLLILGRMDASMELRGLRDQLLNSLKELCPTIYDAYTPINEQSVHFLPSTSRSAVELLSSPINATALLSVSENADFSALLRDPRPRMLEHLSYTYRFNGLSLAGVTHMTRHRMQSLSVPPLWAVDFTRYVLPETVTAENRQLYVSVFEASARLAEQFKRDGQPKELLPYVALSGHTVDILSTMNARELLLFFKLRTCRRAQWEIRAFAVDLLNHLQAISPQLFRQMGPSCFVDGACPEGRLSCGQMAAVRAAFGDHA